MAVYLEQENFDWFDFHFPEDKKGVVKFRDEDKESRPKKIKPWQGRVLQSSRGWSLLEDSEPLLVEACRLANIPARWISQQAVYHLGQFFNNLAVKKYSEFETLERWQTDDFNKKREILTLLWGRVFEEIVTREFKEKHPGYFIMGNRLTYKVISPLFHAGGADNFSPPDHLIFEKYKDHTRLVGFLEAKKASRVFDYTDILKQLDREYRFLLALSDNMELQTNLRRQIFNAISTFPPFTMAKNDQMEMWLAVTKDSTVQPEGCPGWVNFFRSSVKSDAIEYLIDYLVSQKFLPQISEFLKANTNKDRF